MRWFANHDRDETPEWVALALWVQAETIYLVRNIVATFDEVRASYKAYAQAQKDRADTAEAALSAANDRAQASAQALADFQANDADTDAAQAVAVAAQKAQEDADALQGDLDSLQAAPAPTEPVDETPVDAPVDTPVETPAPVDETPAEPVVDVPENTEPVIEDPAQPDVEAS